MALASLTAAPAMLAASSRHHAMPRVAPKSCRIVRAAASNPVGQGQEESSLARREVMLAALAAAFATSAAYPALAADCELQTAPDGLQFCDTKVGEGPAPVKGALIRCHYTGRLASNNAVFDSSYERGKPLSFKVGVHEVISGWDEGILGGEGIPAMREGGKRRLVIPSELAYGERGAGRGVIPPNATLIFDVELLGKPGRR